MEHFAQDAWCLTKKPMIWIESSKDSDSDSDSRTIEQCNSLHWLLVDEVRLYKRGGDYRIHRVQGDPPLPRTMEELVIPQFYQTLDDGTLFLQFDNGRRPSQKKMSRNIFNSSKFGSA
jgi:hypothetical protein